MNMNEIGLSTHKNEYVPVKPNKRESVGTWGLNILTLGIYSTLKTLGQWHHIKKMNLSHANLEGQRRELKGRREHLENRLSLLMTKMHKPDQDIENLQTELKKISDEKSKLDLALFSISPSKPKKIPANFSNIALKIIAGIGLLIANIATIGILGACQDYSLKKRINVLRATYGSNLEQFNEEKLNKLHHLDQLIETTNHFLSLKQAHQEIQNTDLGKAHLAVEQAKEEMDAIIKAQQLLDAKLKAALINESNLVALEKSQKKHIAENDKRVADIREEIKQAKENKDKLVAEIAQLEKEQKALLNKQMNLQSEAAIAALKVKNGFMVEHNHSILKSALKKAPELVKKGAEMWPIPPKYVKENNDDVILGAIDIDDPNKEDQFTPEHAALAKEYNDRYEHCKSASEIIEESFNHAFKTLQKKEGSKYQLTPNSLHAELKAIYLYMVFDLLKGAAVVQGGCHGYELLINSNVKMLSSKPETILQQVQLLNGDLSKPTAMIRFQQIDDFTPSERAMAALGGHKNGVDPIGAKWILNKLTEDEREYLLTYLMAPIVDIKHPDYQALMKYISNGDPRLKLIEKAAELIKDISIAIQIKFGDNVLKRCWDDVKKSAVK